MEETGREGEGRLKLPASGSITSNTAHHSSNILRDSRPAPPFYRLERITQNEGKWSYVMEVGGQKFALVKWFKLSEKWRHARFLQVT